MKEIGRVSKIIKEGLAEVEFKAGSACAKCGRCSMGVSGEMFIEAENKMGAKVGDMIEVEILPSSLLASSFLIYIVPIIFLVVGYFVGVSVHPLILSGLSLESFGIIFALLFMFISFILLKVYDRYLSQAGKPCAKILRKVGEV